MRSEIIKTKFLCKNEFSTIPRLNSYKGVISTVKFIPGKWYDVEYQTWWSKDLFKLNGGHYKYWATDEHGDKEEMSKTYMNILFYMNDSEVRDKKLDNILSNFL
jgi:hypothetical protein